MALVSLTNVEILNNPASFKDGFECEITFEAMSDLPADLEFQFTYTVSVDDIEKKSLDYELDSLDVGPVGEGVSKFVHSVPAPPIDEIPDADAHSPALLIITCSFMQRQFVQVAFFVNPQYKEELGLVESETDEAGETKLVFPSKPVWDKLDRKVEENPRIQLTSISWSESGEEEVFAETETIEVAAADEADEPEAEEEEEEDYEEDEEDDEDDSDAVIDLDATQEKDEKGFSSARNEADADAMDTDEPVAGKPTGASVDAVVTSMQM